MKRFYTGFIWGLTLFTAGAVFGLGQSFFTTQDVIRIAYERGYTQGRVDFVGEVIEAKTKQPTPQQIERNSTIELVLR